MVGGGAIVDGVRRWLHRRSCVTATDFSPTGFPGGDAASTSAGAASDSSFMVQDDLEFLLLKPVRVPNRHRHPNLVQFDLQRKVS